MDKQLRITLLLLMDSVFALVELGVGYAVHSLALVADSFHMFNDILSLIVALWAVKVSRSGTTPTFSYGLQRAEVLGALINAVFLLALCVTIFLEAIQRFIEPPEITNPKLILVVGVLGLLSNLLGLVLFHEHGHSHGGAGHGHSHGDVEAGAHSSGSHSHTHGFGNSHDHNSSVSGQGPISDLMPESVLAREEERLLSQTSSYGSTSDGHSSTAGNNHIHDNQHDSANPMSHNNSQGLYGRHGAAAEGFSLHNEHHHARPKQDKDQKAKKSMNMEGVFLHVLGDALGNIGVIVTAIFIWKTDYSWRFYFDPIVSLLITAIIFSTAVPLCLRASKVLLQATPSSVNCAEVAEDIQSLPGVEEVHDLHIWQLSENETVGTVHVTIDGPSSNFSKLSRSIQECFAGYGVPSITIQPEFIEEPSQQQSAGLRQCQSNGNLLAGGSQ